MQTFTTSTPITVDLDIPAGRVQFIAADRADTVVDIRPANPGKGRDVKMAEQTTVAYSEGMLRIAAPSAKHQILGPSGSVEVTVQLPVGSAVHAKAGGAEFRGVGRLGDVAIEGAYGAHDAVKLDEAADVRLTVLAGDVQLGRLTGPAAISTQKGDITVGEARHGALELSTQMGNVTVAAARGVSATLDAGTSYGRITNALLNTDGTAAGLAIHATTAMGDITARSL